MVNDVSRNSANHAALQALADRRPQPRTQAPVEIPRPVASAESLRPQGSEDRLTLSPEGRSLAAAREPRRGVEAAQGRPEQPVRGEAAGAARYRAVLKTLGPA